MFHQSRHHIHGVGKYLQLADGPHLSPRFLRHDILHRFNQLGCRQQRIVPFFHGRGSRMIGKAANLHIVPVNADDPFHHANRYIGFVQRRALLDV